MDNYEQYHVKRCKRCGETKPFDEFHYCEHTSDKCTVYCKACRTIEAKKWRNRNVKRHLSITYVYKYGITMAQKEELIKQQNGRCYLCDEVLPDDPWDRCIEHDKETKQVFGIAHNRCNTGIAYFNHDPHLMIKVAKRMLRLRVKKS